jgi:hypothetical protein
VDTEDQYADLKRHRIEVQEVQAIEPRKIQKRRGHFIKFPMLWRERLSDAHGKTWALAADLLYLHWKDNGEPIKLANGMLAIDGISRWSKYRSLKALEQLGLISVERRERRSPIVRLNTG